MNKGVEVAIMIGIAAILLIIKTVFFNGKEPESLETLTVDELKKFKKSPSSEIIVSNLTAMKEKITEEKIFASFEKFVQANPQAVIFAEYDSSTDTVLNYAFAKNCDDKIYSLLSANGGYVVIED